MSDGPEITPEYVADLQRQLAAAQTERAQIASENQRLEAHLKVSEMLRADLERMLANERHARWGKKSEKLGAEQQHLPFEDIEVVQGMLEAASEEAEKATRKKTERAKAASVNQGQSARPSGARRNRDRAGQHALPLRMRPDGPRWRGQNRAARHHSGPVPCPRHGAPQIHVPGSCDGKSHAQAPAPEYLVPRGLPTEALVAHTMVAKFGDYLPFYRQADIYRRQGVELDRSVS